ncbi:MAG: Hsp20/alpha crystallin family protein [Syntrophobacteraceae bacterium]
MTLIRWLNRPEFTRPTFEAERLQREMNQLFNSFLDRGERVWRSSVFPALNVSEDENNIYVRAELPGVDPKDLDISIEGDALTLRGERKSSEPGGKVNYHRREREMGRFRRVLSFPTKIDADKAGASFKSGVLTLTLPKAEEAKPRQVSIKTE